jgi:RND family efflux transporter MFP subunit
MTKRWSLILVVIVAVAAFLGGYLVSGSRGKKPSAGGRTVLYYVDPMHPAYKSDKPGIAPDCGMQLEPVYADGQLAAAPGSVALPPGSVLITPDKQQLIGVRTAVVEKASVSRTLRALGRVVPEESRLYRINTSIEGLVKRTYPVSTGNLVQRDQVLATFYTPEFFISLSALVSIMDGLDRHLADPIAKKNNYRDQLTVRNAQNSLINMGMSETQLLAIMTTRKVVEEIEIRSPATGFILARNIAYNQRFEKGSELFRIADLSKVWVLADLYENEASLLKPGMSVRLELPHQNRTLTSRVSQALPLVDPVSRTTRVRLEVDNPGYLLRPDMFVNVEFTIPLPEMITVTAEAVLDSGLRKTVFVDRGNGWFEPRPVETGRSLGDRVEILRGLTPGEKIVVSGNFLIDSESRLKQASAGIFGKPGRDPVCGMALDEDRAKAAGLTRQFNGKSFYFCSLEDMAKFDKNPQKYASGSGAIEPMTMPAGSGAMKMEHSAGKMTMPGMKSSPRSGMGPDSEPMEWGPDGKVLMPGMKDTTKSGAMPMESPADQMPLPGVKMAPVELPAKPDAPAAPANNLESILEQERNAK